MDYITTSIKVMACLLTGYVEAAVLEVPEDDAPKVA